MTTIRFTVHADPGDVETRARERAMAAFGTTDPALVEVDVGTGDAVQMVSGDIIGWAWRVEATLTEGEPR